MQSQPNLIFFLDSFPFLFPVTKFRAEEIRKFIKCQDKEMEEFVAEREKLMKAHEERKTVLKLRQWEEEVALENELSNELNSLMSKYTPKH